jgi:murein DD-endopeptidase MepM/ murein hydrolase activator NlpD
MKNKPKRHKPISKFFYLICLSVISGCTAQNADHSTVPGKLYASVYDSVFRANPSYVAHGFDFPVGKPNAKGYYDAQPFGENQHLGNDWNSLTGGNSDLGDPIYSIGNGYVSCAYDFGSGWGNVIRIVHCLDTAKRVYVESLYGHCREMLVKKGQLIKRGTHIGNIGNCGGQYYAHLHFEIRRLVDKELGGGYSTDTSGFYNPTFFIKKHRPH